jgi:hypothetical protein
MICNQIGRQRHQDGNLPIGFMSGMLFKSLTELIEKNCYYYDITLFFRNKDLIKSVFEDYKKAYITLIKEIDIGREEHFNEVSKNLNLNYKTRMLKLIKKKTEEFITQKMTFRTDYHSRWFYAEANHHSGKFAPSDSRSGMDICSQQHHKRQEYVNHMTTEFENAKNYLAKRILDIYTTEFSCDTYTVDNWKQFIGNTHKLPIYYIYHKEHKKNPDAYPILVLKEPEMSISCKIIYYYQKLFAQEAQNENYYLENIYNITEDNKFVLELVINGNVIYSITKEYTPLFYTGKEAIWFYWFGGNINIDGNTTTTGWNDYYTDNICSWTVWYPTYQNREGVKMDLLSESYIKKDALQKINMDNNIKISQLFSTYSKKVQEKTLTTKLSKLIDELDVWYNIIFTFMNLGNISKYSDKIIECEKKYLLSGSSFKNYNFDFSLYQKPNLHQTRPKILLTEVNFLDDFLKAICETYDNFNDKMLVADTFINTTKIDEKLLDLIKETIPLITSRYSPCEKEKWTQEMNEILIKILEVSQNTPDAFESFDLMGFIKSVKKSWDEKIKNGTVKGNFKEHAVECLLMIGNGSDIAKALCI